MKFLNGIRHLNVHWSDLQHSFRSGEQFFLLLPAMVIGACAGLGAFLMFWMIKTFQSGFASLETFLHGTVGLPAWLAFAAIPATGGLVVGPLIYWFAREAKGHGVPEVMFAVLRNKGIIRPAVVWVKAVTAALTISSGGSVGSEGPIVQIGAAIGSFIGRGFKFSPKHLRMFVGCGAAGGIAAAFNAPIAGTMFCVEIILGEFGFVLLTPIVVSSVVATVVSHSLLGNHLFFELPQQTLASSWELLSFVILGFLAAFAAVLFSWTLYALEDFADRFKKFPDYLKPVVGGFAVGLVGLLAPEVMGVGTSVMESIVLSEVALELLVFLFVAKLVATNLTLASGGSGGIFAPSLFLGVILGKLVGVVSNAWINTGQDTTGVFALAGMAAVVGAATHAPITAILIVFELTNDYNIILPLMMTTFIAVTVASKVDKESIYTRKLVRRGVDLREGVEQNLLKRIPVSRASTGQFKLIDPEANIEDTLQFINQSSCQSWPVVNNQQFLGMLTADAVSNYLATKEEDKNATLFSRLEQSPNYLADEDQNLYVVLEKMRKNRLNEIYLTGNGNQIVGLVDKSSILDSYSQHLVSEVANVEIASGLKGVQQGEILEVAGDYALLQLPIHELFVGKSLMELGMRSRWGVDVLLIKRTNKKTTKVWQPSPQDKLVKEDQLVIFGSQKTVLYIQQSDWAEII